MITNPVSNVSTKVGVNAVANAISPPRASIVVPAYNVAHCIAETLTSLLAQTERDFEIVVVNDGSTDDTLAVVRRFDDPRIRIVNQRNRGLAGARNTGIAESRAPVIGFCDSDDLWLPTKLAQHLAHLDANPEVGLSFAGSRLIDQDGNRLPVCQRPRLRDITVGHIFRRNPIGNGSVAVFRREALQAIAFRPVGETERDWYFDETFRQSEDIECWMRFALTTDWTVEGIPGLLTEYRIDSRGLSANIDRQLRQWERMVAKLSAIAPDVIRTIAPAARAYQYRYLCRRAVMMGEGPKALRLAIAALRSSRHPLWAEPIKTVTTLAAALAVAVVGGWSPAVLCPPKQAS
ncbi:MAG: glycosyltransferase family 2 protein [Rhodospirillaceae bacterium]